MGCRARHFCSVFFPRASSVRKRFPTSSRLAFSFSSSAGDGFLSFFDGGGGGGDGESPAYKRHLQCHRPPTLRPWKLPHNTCSLIGTVAMPLRPWASGPTRVGAYTVLEVEKPPWSRPRRAFSPFRILVLMWDDLAQVSLRYLKPNDSVYVSGHLSSYEKVDANGKREILHRVVVRDLNYVQQAGKLQPPQDDPHAVCKTQHQSSSGEGSSACVPPSGEDSAEESEEEKLRRRLRLWQVFFANPHEWWDNRRQKLHRRSPDFKHKNTGEALWLRPDDPPWVGRQLELVDLRGAGNGGRRGVDSGRHHMSELL